MKQLFNLAVWQTLVLLLKQAFCVLPKQALQQKWIRLKSAPACKNAPESRVKKFRVAFCNFCRQTVA
jgi:hypothetical protein